MSDDNKILLADAIGSIVIERTLRRRLAALERALREYRKQHDNMVSETCCCRLCAKATKLLGES